jgi:hypothetical protein
MRLFTVISLVLLSNIIGCAHRAPSDRMLDKRADYGIDIITGEKIANDSILVGPSINFPKKTRTKAVLAWLHRRDLVTKDYFWGSWVTLQIDAPGWGVNPPNLPEDDVFIDGK